MAFLGLALRYIGATLAGLGIGEIADWFKGGQQGGTDGLTDQVTGYFKNTDNLIKGGIIGLAIMFAFLFFWTTKAARKKILKF